MYRNPQSVQSDEAKALRREGGAWLKELRLAAGLTQHQLAELVGTEYYTFISQLETGRGRIPPERYLAWAEALGLDPTEFVRELLRYYDPLTYRILFAMNVRAPSQEARSFSRDAAKPRPVPN